MSIPFDILGAYWSTAGGAQPGSQREWSPFTWSQRCAEAARVGLTGLGIWHSDLFHLLEQHSLSEIGGVFSDAGLEHLELEFLMDWFLPVDDPRRVVADESRRVLFQAAAQLGAHHIKVGNIRGIPCELNRVTEAFGELCAEAANHHESVVVYEFTTSDVNLNSLDKAVAVVEGASAANGGLALDTWHLAKLGISPQQLASVPARYLSYVELSDGMNKSMPDRVEETVNHRQLPGEGEFDLPGYIEALTQLGYAGPWGVEVLSAALRVLPITDAFDRLAQTTTATLSKTSAHA